MVALKTLPPHLARDLADVAGGLAYAHVRHVVHRDVKAENILIDSGGDRAVVNPPSGGGVRQSD